MRKHKNKVIELFKREKPQGDSLNDFHRWLIDEKNKEQKEEAMSHLWETPSIITQEEASDSFFHFSSRINPLVQKTKKIKVMLRYVAAAVVFICIATSYMLTRQSATELNTIEFYSSIGEVNKVTLPDGSTIEMNSSTIILYPDDFGKTTRTLYLNGEANFKVVKNPSVPFVVKSNQFAVTALGTEFNVAAYPEAESYYATLISGSIKVEDTDSRTEHKLNIGEQFSFHKETREYAISDVGLEEATAWQRGELIFKGATIQEIADVLQRHYGVIIQDKRKQRNKDKYNFKFQKNAPITEVLEVLETVSDYSFQKLNEEMYFMKN